MPNTVKDERGSASVEAVVVGPAVVLLLCLVIFGGRVAMAHQMVQGIAADAARAASLARTPTQARSAAARAVEAGIAGHHPCASHDLALDLDGFAKPVGTPASVTATLTCRIATADLTLPGVQGQLTVGATMSSPLDTYRERR